MPDMDGFQLTRSIKALRPEVPVVLVTGYSEKSTTEETAACGAAALIMKPISKAELSKVLAGVMKKTLT